MVTFKREIGGVRAGSKYEGHTTLSYLLPARTPYPPPCHPFCVMLDKEVLNWLSARKRGITCNKPGKSSYLVRDSTCSTALCLFRFRAIEKY